MSKNKKTLSMLGAVLIIVGLLLVPLSSVFAYTAWDGNFHPYAIGDLVTYSGRDHRCQQAHTSQPDWHPDVTPALWVDLGPTGGTTAPTATKTRTPTPGGPTATRTRTATPGATATK